MTTLKSAKCYSRIKARKLFIAEKLPLVELPKEICIHHIDENPFNNDLSNLMLIHLKEHSSYHNKGKGRPVDLLNVLSNLEKWLTIYNDF